MKKNIIEFIVPHKDFIESLHSHDIRGIDFQLRYIIKAKFNIFIDILWKAEKLKYTL
jgi:hypothetical protein